MNEPISQGVAQFHLGQLNLEAQGNFKRVVFVCTGGMLRSATAAQWAASALDWNTRSCGTRDSALPPAHANLMEWADVIYCMEDHHRASLVSQFPWAEQKIQVLNIPDLFEYRHPTLVTMLERHFAADIQTGE
jgi:protein-tyrosine phosphatase